MFFQNIDAKKIVFLILLATSNLYAQRGYYDAPYKRYEADMATLTDAVITPKSYAQSSIQSEASDQVCVVLSNVNSAIEWTLTEAADGLVIRYSVPNLTTATIGIYDENTRIAGLTLTSNWSWESLWNNGNPNNGGISNLNPKMRFDEVRYKLPAQIPVSGKLKLVLESGTAHIDFAELEPIPVALTAPTDAATYIGNGSTLQAFINSHGGQKIFVPTGVYNMATELYFGVANTQLLGAGMWYTQLNFTALTSNNGGLRANTTGVSFSDLYLTTNQTSRSNSYKGINGVYTATSTIKNIWAEHFECGAWIAQYNFGGPAIADGFLMTNCRFRNNYADGINLCKGTSNAIVEHCSFRNNGDDDQAIWCANNQECINNTFRNNTSENCWRASGLAIYGGKNNKAYDLIIKDNLEAGIRISNSFPGAGFNAIGSHDLHDITMINCGTFNDLYNGQVGAIDIFCSNNAGTQVRNVNFSNIDILDAKNDAIFIQKKAGDGIYNLTFNNITVNGTGKEYPYNNALNNTIWRRGQFVLFVNSPNGNGTFCNMNYSNRGGNALFDESTSGIGSFSWTQAPLCEPLSNPVFDQQSVVVYPNPASNFVTISFDEFKNDVNVKLINAQGKTVLEQKNVSGSQVNIGISSFQKGIYLIEITTQERRLVQKLMIE